MAGGGVPRVRWQVAVAKAMAGGRGGDGDGGDTAAVMEMAAAVAVVGRTSQKVGVAGMARCGEHLFDARR